MESMLPGWSGWTRNTSSKLIKTKYILCNTPRFPHDKNNFHKP